MYIKCVYVILHINYLKNFSGKQKILGRYSINPRGKKVRILRPQSWACHRLAHDCESSLKNFVCDGKVDKSLRVRTFNSSTMLWLRVSLRFCFVVFGREGWQERRTQKFIAVQLEFELCP